MILLRSQFGLMLAGIILSFCMNGCGAWYPGHPATPEPSAGTAMTSRPAGTDIRGDIFPADPTNWPYPWPDKH
jgi:hypothetical protein